ncbi:MAG: CRTAC1 family protein, partial [Planctomycetota bacterium]|nr:CRTAC1 family protein [Planctomycetota bacterium]
DVYLTCVKQDRLLLNEGNFHFRDIAVAAGIVETEWGTGVSFFDYDRDGLLDIVVANYTHDDKYDHQTGCGFLKGIVSYCGPHKFSPTVDRLYHNDGLQLVDGLTEPQLHFTDVTASAGMSEVTSYGFAVVTADFTDDDWPDILIANDSQPNRLWVNQRNGTFLEQAVAFGVAVNAFGAASGSMGIAFGDIDRNQSQDFVISTLSTESTILFQSSGKGYFTDATQLSGLNLWTRRHTGWGAALIDLDHDGWLDLPLANGLVIPCHSRFPPHGDDNFQVRSDSVQDSADYWNDYADRNLLLLSTGTGLLRVATQDQGGDFARAVGSARCLLYGDPDEDGDIDLLVTNSGSRARFYRNEFPKSGHWIRLRLLDRERKRDAIGARVTVECGDDRWTASVTPCTSFLASNDVRVHFGVGTHTRIDRIIVRWPDGPVEECVEEFAGGTVDRDLQIVRGQGKRLRENQ